MPVNKTITVAVIFGVLGVIVGHQINRPVPQAPVPATPAFTKDRFELTMDRSSAIIFDTSTGEITVRSMAPTPTPPAPVERTIDEELRDRLLYLHKVRSEIEETSKTETMKKFDVGMEEMYQIMPDERREEWDIDKKGQQALDVLNVIIARYEEEIETVKKQNPDGL
jgi:hypothetical protein